MDASRREEVVGAAREAAERGLNRGRSGNVSARLPSGGMLITPSGVPPGRIEAPDVVHLGLDGTVRGEARGRPSTEWRLHAAVYRKRPAADAVVHTHSPFATALACLGREIPAVHYLVAAAGGDSVPCARYATFGTGELAEAAVEALEGRRACLLSNHGAVALGGAPAEALELAALVEELAEIYWRALQVGDPESLPAEEIERVRDRLSDYGE